MILAIVVTTRVAGIVCMFMVVVIVVHDVGVCVVAVILVIISDVLSLLYAHM